MILLLYEMEFVLCTYCNTIFIDKQNMLHSMFCWPFISIHPFNVNQLYTLFILSLFRQSTSTCFGHICSPSSGGTLCIYTEVGTCWVFYHLLYIYSITPDDGLQTWPKHVEVHWRNKLRINIASSWFLLQGKHVTSNQAMYDSTYSSSSNRTYYKNVKF